MSWPLSQDYNEAIQSPQTSFSDAELRGGQAAVNALGMPMPCSGNFADVYRVFCPASQRAYAVKCFTRQIPGLRERYQQISLYLEQVKLPFMVGFTFLDKGIQIRGDWYPILKMEWAEGMPLNQLVKNHLDKPQLLDKLCQMWVKLASRLREANLAHCDLQHGNVLLVPGSKTGSLGMKLVDYDGMCVPALTMLKSLEVGHPAYQHPQRAREGIFSLDVDRFSHLTIYTALRCLVASGPNLWERYDNGDNLLFCQDDFKKPQDSELFKELLQSENPEVRKLAEALNRAAQQSLERTPLLTEIVSEERLAVIAQPQKVVKTPSVAVSSKSQLVQATSAGVKPATAPEPEKVPLLEPGEMPRWHQRPAMWAAAGCLGGVLLAGIAAALVVVVLLSATNNANLTDKNLVAADTSKETTGNKPPAASATDAAGKKPIGSDPAQTEKKKVVAPPIDQSKKEKKPAPPKTPVPNVNEDGWVDLLQATDPSIHTLAGQWYQEGVALVSDEHILSRLQVPYAPGPEYVLHLTVEPINGNGEFFIGLALPGNRHVDVVLSDGRFVSGLDLFSGKGFATNNTGTSGLALTPNKPNEVICTVGAGAIHVNVDGRPVIDWQGNFNQLSTNLTLWMLNNRVLSISSQRAAVRVTRLQIKPINGEGQLLEGMPYDGVDIGLRKKLLGSLGRLSGTEWINSNNDILEWNWTGAFFYNGVKKPFQAIDEKTIKLMLDAKSNTIDTLTFDPALKSFDQVREIAKMPGPVYTGTRLPIGAWFELRIVVEIKGKHHLHITPTEARWETIAGAPPIIVAMNGTSWNPAQQPLTRHTDLAAVFGKDVDLKRARVDKIRGAGAVSLQSGTNALTLVFEGGADQQDPKKKPDTMEVSLNLRVGDQKPNPCRVISHFHYGKQTVALAASPNGSHAAICSDDGLLRYWNLLTATVEWQIGGQAALPNTVCFVDDGSMIAFVGPDGFMRVVNVNNHKKVGKVDINGRTVNAIYPIAGKKQVLFVTGDSKISVLDLQSGKGSDLVPLPSESNGRLLALAENGLRALCTSDTENILVWDLQGKKELPSLPVKTAGAAALSKDGSLAATCMKVSSIIRLWDAATGKQIRIGPRAIGATEIQYLEFSPDAGRLLSVHVDGKLRIWDVANLREVGQIGVNPGSRIKVARFMPGGRHIVVADQDGIIRVWRFAN